MFTEQDELLQDELPVILDKGTGMPVKFA